MQTVRFVAITWRVALFVVSSISLAAQPRVRKPYIVYDDVLVKVDAMGDFMLASHALRKLSSSRRILLITSSANQPLIRLAGLHFDVYYVDLSKIQLSLIYRLRVLFHLRGISCERVINIHRHRTLHVSESIVLALRSRNKVTALGDLTNSSRLERKLSEWMYRLLLDDSEAPLHEMYFNSWLVNKIFLPEFNLLDKYSDTANTVEKTTSSSKNTIILAIGASAEEKTVDVRTLCRAVSESKGTFNVVAIGPSHMNRHLNVFEEELPGEKWLVGQTTVTDLEALFAQAKVLIGNDSFPIHLAQHLGVPAFAVRSGLHWGKFIPYPSWSEVNTFPKDKICHCEDFCQNISVSGRRECIDIIETSELKEAIRSFLISVS